MLHGLRLPLNALLVLAEGCRCISVVSLRDECDIEVLDNVPATMPHFPRLSKLKIGSFGNRVDGERYFTPSVTYSCP
jgi:hypothetical protein